MLATGTIATKMANTIKEMEGVELYAIASRSLEKAEAFKNEHGFKKAYGSYEELAKDTESDIVYVATPHSRHHEDITMLLNNNHHVLCEKPITVNGAMAREVYDLAKQKQRVLADATWTRYMPFVSLTKQAAIRHDFGRLKNIHSAFGISKTDSQRMVDPKLAGGALLDLGIYPITFALIFANSEVVDIKSTMSQYYSGVDESNAMILTFDNGIVASLQSSLNSIMENKTQLYYERGRIELDEMPNPQHIKVFDDEGELIESMAVPSQISGYEYEVEEMIETIRNNKLEMPSFPIEKSLEVIDLMDELRKQWNLVYPFESE